MIVIEGMTISLFLLRLGRGTAYSVVQHRPELGEEFVRHCAICELSQKSIEAHGRDMLPSRRHEDYEFEQLSPLDATVALQFQFRIDRAFRITVPS